MSNIEDLATRQQRRFAERQVEKQLRDPMFQAMLDIHAHVASLDEENRDRLLKCKKDIEFALAEAGMVALVALSWVGLEAQMRGAGKEVPPFEG